MDVPKQERAKQSVFLFPFLNLANLFNTVALTVQQSIGEKKKRLNGVTMTYKRKGSVQIRFEILEFLFFSDKPQLRTHLWRKATDASYDDFLKHLNYLKDKRFVNESSDGQLSLTAEGRKVYTSLRDSLPSLL